MKKTKVLWLSDFLCATGFGQVAHNLLKRLLATDQYEVTVIGINHHGEPYDYNEWPLKIYPAINFTAAAKDNRYADVYGRQRVLEELGTGQYDLLFTLQDSFIIEAIAKEIVETKKQLKAQGMKPFSWIFYYPIDSEIKENWVTQSIALSDFPVAYTEFGRAQTRRFAPHLPIEVIYHGVDTAVFHPLPAPEVTAFRQDFFQGLAKDKFVVTNINRNQRRKDIPRTISAFAEFKKQRPHSLLYLHMKWDDNGGNILEMARHYGLRQMEDYAFPPTFSAQQGFPLEIVNKIYNASDAVISTTLGEGWGLSSTEAMATKTPVIFPDNTSLREIIGSDRGWLVPAGVKPDDWVCLGMEDMNQYRPITSVTAMVEALIAVHDTPAEAARRAQIAYDWVQTITWDKLLPQWQTVFERAARSNQQQAIVGLAAVGRNEPCPMCQTEGVSVKWKKCRKHNPTHDLLEAKHALPVLQK